MYNDYPHIGLGYEPNDSLTHPVYMYTIVFVYSESNSL